MGTSYDDGVNREECFENTKYKIAIYSSESVENHSHFPVNAALSQNT
jgi:hypothetical protein